MNKVFICIITAIFALSCYSAEIQESQTYEPGHYIYAFYEVDRFYTGYLSGLAPDILENKQTGYFTITLLNNDNLPFSTEYAIFALGMDGDKYLYKDELKEMQERLGDNSPINLSMRPRIVSVNHFVGLKIISNSDFNGIPAGEPLNGIIKVFGATAYPVFKVLHCEKDYSDQKLEDTLEGYNKLTGCHYESGHQANIFPRFQPGYFWFEKLVSELQPDDLFLLDNCLYFQFTSKPSIGTQTLTITFKEESGKTISTSVDVEFPS